MINPIIWLERLLIKSIYSISTRFINHLNHTTAMENPTWVDKILEIFDESEKEKEVRKDDN